MSVAVTLTGGPLDGETVTVTGPWPQAFLTVGPAGNESIYEVDDDTADPDDTTATAAYVSGADGPATADGPYSDDTIGPEGPPGLDGPPGPAGPEGPAGAGYTPRGDWTADALYAERDVVQHNGSSWWARTANTAAEPATLAGIVQWGMLAEKGSPGDSGDPGEPGADGASAYEVAVANGFTGTEAAWLDSLIGPEGPEGPPGSGGGGAGGPTWFDDFSTDRLSEYTLIRGDGTPAPAGAAIVSGGKLTAPGDPVRLILPQAFADLDARVTFNFGAGAAGEFGVMLRHHNTSNWLYVVVGRTTIRAARFDNGAFSWVTSDSGGAPANTDLTLGLYATDDRVAYVVCAGDPDLPDTPVIARGAFSWTFFNLLRTGLMPGFPGRVALAITGGTPLQIDSLKVTGR